MPQALGEECAGGVGQYAEQLPVLLEDPADAQGNGEDPMSVTDIEEEFLEEPLHPGLLSFLAAGQADLALAGEGDEPGGVAIGALKMGEPGTGIGAPQEVPDRLLGPLAVVAVGLPELLVLNYQMVRLNICHIRQCLSSHILLISHFPIDTSSVLILPSGIPFCIHFANEPSIIN